MRSAIFAFLLTSLPVAAADPEHRILAADREKGHVCILSADGKVDMTSSPIVLMTVP